MVRGLLPLGAALLGATAVLADGPPKCTLDKKCPKEAPCCSQYGECGVGAYCLGGCDPRMSYSLDSCVPAPVCKDKVYKMDNLDRYKDISEYLGDSSKTDWVGQGEPLLYNGNVLLTMPPKSVGTVLSTTTYMWYGKVKARLKTSRGAGVVTAFILFSDVKDEIDYEFVGVDLQTAQTNYYFQGIPDYNNSGNITVSGNTYDEFHDYEIHWTPDEITWLVDGKVGRTKKRSETWNETLNQWDYPQTPSRVQLSIWPGGAETNAKGTIDWAGGPIDWDSDEIKNFGYYFATFSEVSVECYKTDTPPGTSKGKSYYYDDVRGTNDTVVDSNKRTTLKSLLGTGTDMDKGDTTSSGKPSSTSSVNAIPGGGSTPPNQVPGGSNPSSSDGSSSGSGSSGSSTCSSEGFQQHCGEDGSSSTDNKNDGARGVDRTLGASAFAVIVGFAGLLLL
ncbi:glycoside hydrolase family 16 protein [Thermothelomyces thermophilus ATCC 42464]|uniref:Crh-like protein n=1 Tax=Thermothelomyces thermophilus (strain ATCC 42464 / BCRC 31852 / DSM 1799) TaxID=573729 RepID=G2QC37_THET4|nr:glycoside hydrolase family 16 protein [Thermothelomyces thermophilus ATCC 42464]AEO57264.1 glycoside hydrolase family 16 protein [Thermothelomyces thermophilus ATCC 42464]